jgi:hypothetical protein
MTQNTLIYLRDSIGNEVVCQHKPLINDSWLESRDKFAIRKTRTY